MSVFRKVYFYLSFLFAFLSISSYRTFMFPHVLAITNFTIKKRAPKTEDFIKILILFYKWVYIVPWFGKTILLVRRYRWVNRIKRSLTQSGHFLLEKISLMSFSCWTNAELIMCNMSCTLHSISVSGFLVPIRKSSLQSLSTKLLPLWRVCNWSLTYHVPCCRISKIGIGWCWFF